MLILLAVAATIVAPSLLPSRPEQPALGTLVERARDASVRRGQPVRLRIDRSGAWQAVAGTAPRSELLISGRLPDPPAGPIDLIFSPLGTCAPAVESDPAGSLAAYDALTCEAPPSSVGVPMP